MYCSTGRKPAVVNLSAYREPKPRRLRQLIWRVLNVAFFPLLSNGGRRFLLKCFGADIGKSLIYRSVRIHAPWNLHVGDFSCIGPHVELYSKAPIRIGDNAVISQNAYLCTASHDVESPVMALTTAPITIGNGCWVAARAALLPGVTLGDGAVVGLGAVVAKTLPPNAIAVGNPARVVRERTIYPSH